MAAILSRLAPSHRWLQFSVRSILLLILVVGVWFGRFVDRAQRQQRAVEAIEAGLTGRVVYRHELPATFGPHDFILADSKPRRPSGTPGPVWLCRLFGDEYFNEVVGAAAPLGEPAVVLKESLQDLPWLEELRISVHTPDDFTSLRNLKRLRRLFLSNWSADVRLECLRDSRDLEFLAFKGDGKKPNVEHLEEFRNLRELDLNSGAISDDDVRHVCALPRLERLVLFCEISDQGMKSLEGLKSLESLTISAPNITDAGAQSLRELVNLKELSIRGTKMTDRGLESIANLPRLKTLTLRGEHFTREGLSRLNRNLTSLTFFAVPRPISDSDLELLQRLASLERLLILNGFHHPPTAITDAGLAMLKKMPQLKEISFESRYVTKAGVADLKRALPACDVRIRK